MLPCAPLATLTPITLGNGFRFYHFSDECPRCDTTVEFKDWGAFVSRLGPRVVNLDLESTCPACQLELLVKLRLTALTGGRAHLERQHEGDEWVSYGITR